MEDRDEQGLVQVGLKSGRSFVIRGSLSEVRDRIVHSNERLEEFELQNPPKALVHIAPDSVDSIKDF